MSGTMENVEVIEVEDQDEGEFEDEESEDDELIPSPRVSNKDITDDGDEEELNGFEMEGLNCSICTEPWTSGGEHQICCLPCGHIYGLSCIKKWIRIGQRSSAGKCPQCNRRCTLKDVRVLYATRLCVLDAELQKKVRTLEAKCASLKQKNADCCNKEVESQEREADLHLKVEKLTEKTKYLERLLKDSQRESFTSNLGFQRKVINDIGNGSGSEVCSGAFTLQREFQVDGGRCFDMDASGELMILARRLNGMGGTSLLTKISLVAPYEREDIHLPANTKAVRALCVRPCTRLALLASLGKKLSIVSTESNNTVLTYDLPAPAWSCSWDIESSHHVYTGLQNGMVLGFDMRQTKTPLESRSGLSCNPIHTLISVAPDSSSGTRTLLTASQIGICEWNIGSTEERPYLIPESKNQGRVCISLAHSGGDDIVASFRPKIEMSCPMAVSQSFPTPSMSCGVEGCHIFYKRSGAQSYQKTGSLVAHVDSIRLPKSCIINKLNRSPMFVAANEVTSDLVLHDISKLAVVQRLKTSKNQIWDVKCTQIGNSCAIGCLSGDVLQLYTSP
ncbi:hypothetical protein L1987_38504 [Smallanthus sonchifolius]|uniref:Uncharacterized protein n=1 Tax=Smallanthus sonchifolius TaxID=185202 RepID=A0ACB9HJD7_9ASTR|nr:hypothetical protein L1987_38504 [Smallanthus sonchifolius]